MISHRRLSRRTFVGLVPAVVAGTALQGRAQTAAQAPPLTALRMGLAPSDGFGEAYYGHETGFFEDVGIDLQLSPFSAEAAIVAAVVGGSLDIGISGPMTIAAAALRGIPVAYIGAGSVYSTAAPTVAMIVGKNSSLRTARDVEGKTLGTYDVRGSIHLGAVAWLEHNGADSTKVKVVEIPRQDLAPSLERGTIDTAVIGEPFLSIATATTARLFAKCFDVMGDKALLGGYFALRDNVAKNATLFRRFNTAMYRTAKWSNANRDKTALILQKYTKITDDAVRHMTRVAYADTLDAARIQPTLDEAFKARFIDKQLSATDIILRI